MLTIDTMSGVFKYEAYKCNALSFYSDCPKVCGLKHGIRGLKAQRLECQNIRKKLLRKSDQSNHGMGFVCDRSRVVGAHLFARRR